MIKILCIGKIKEKYLVDGINEYAKRMESWKGVEIIELKECITNNIQKTIELEDDLIMDKVNKDDYIITLEIDGKMIDSISLANKIDELYTYGNTNIVFVIGGSYGLGEKIKRRSNFKLSFSKFTFPHQLMRLILLEQIYRAFTIINHKEYHK